MKMLFTSDHRLIREVKARQVFGWFDTSNNKWHYLDVSGNEIEYHIEGGISDDELTPAAYFNDRLANKYLGEGFYSFTTHRIDYDMDGEYGVFGIKDSEGNIIAEEQFYEVDNFWHGLCSVRLRNSKWGCIDTFGKLVIPYAFSQPIRFNKYWVAEGDACLIDRNCNPIDDSQLNSIEPYDKDDRYFIIGNFPEEQCAEISRCGDADNLKVNVFDSKTKKIIAKDIPDCSLDVEFTDCAPEIIIAAAELTGDYDRVRVEDSGIIFAEKGKLTTVFDYYK